MSSSSIHPRPEQVAELTRGVSIPFTPLPERILGIIARFLSSAWGGLIQDRTETLASGSEAELNALIAGRLNSMLSEDSAWPVLVRSVTRGSETVSYDGRHLEKRPDLSIHLTGRNPSFALIVECKLLDSASGKTIDMYCTHGLARFIRGDYAWASREAFMLGYVRDGSNIENSLHPFISKNQDKQPDPFDTVALPKIFMTAGMHLAESRHDRSFRYLGPSASSSPGPIAIWHLWLAKA